MAIRRRIARVVQTPAPAPGFIGAGHTAVLVVDPNEFASQDPFIMLADDRLELPAGQHGGRSAPARRVRDGDVGARRNAASTGSKARSAPVTCSG